LTLVAMGFWAAVDLVALEAVFWVALVAVDMVELAAVELASRPITMAAALPC
jgi:hypothetical protein